MVTEDLNNLLEGDWLTLERAKVMIEAQQQKLDAQEVQLSSSTQLVAELREEIERLKSDGNPKNPTPRLDESYSMNAEEKRQADKKGQKRKKKKNRGSRMKTADKIALAVRTEKFYPEDIETNLCRLSHTRVAWRLENGSAVLVAYEIYRYRNQFGKPEGLLGRSEYGIEIILALAYQVYCVGISIDKACQVLAFFEKLKLRKSQADALLNQLSRAWEKEFDALCLLLANSAVIHCDETSWSINSVWAFLNDHLTVLFYGVHKDGKTLGQILDKNSFGGVLVSDDASVYRDFTNAQKCWAHLIRKAIKLTLQSPEEQVYRDFTDRLIEIYRTAQQVKADKRFGDAGRAAKVAELDNEILALVAGQWLENDTDTVGTEDDYRLLCNELMRLMIGQELFTFVLHEPVEGTNNASERQLRPDAISRKTGRTNKTPRGAKRQSIISSVLQSIGKQLESFDLQAVIDEVKRWAAAGQSCFETQLASLGLRVNEPGDDAKTLLDRVVLAADP